jgi:hypothetical protein
MGIFLFSPDWCIQTLCKSHPWIDLLVLLTCEWIRLYLCIWFDLQYTVLTFQIRPLLIYIRVVRVWGVWGVGGIQAWLQSLYQAQCWLFLVNIGLLVWLLLMMVVQLEMVVGLLIGFEKLWSLPQQYTWMVWGWVLVLTQQLVLWATQQPTGVVPSLPPGWSPLDLAA